MCFSAIARFGASFILIPVGIYSVQKAFLTNKQYLILAAIPILFWVQQAFEGVLWLAIADSAESVIHNGALVFLFIADFLWPFLAPLAASFLEGNRRKRQVFLYFSFLRGLFGLSL